MRILLPAVFIVLSSFPSFSQNDSLVFENGNIIVGEVKSLDRGVVIVGTAYSDADFKIEWDKIRN